MSAMELEPRPPIPQALRPAHPEVRDLLRFVRGELARDENRRVVRHLLTGCPHCLEVTRPLWELGERRAGEGGRVARG